jgi:Tannase and feruloyl esterase
MPAEGGTTDASTRGNSADRCKSLAQQHIDQGSVTSAQLFPAGFEASPGTAAAGVPGFDLPESCRVSLLLTPTADSQIKVEVWLPTLTWNGRLQGVDNGGMGGSINRRALMMALKYDYAAASTDTGHEGKDTDASFALGHPERAIDVSWRAIHLTALVAKQLINVFYGQPVRYAYFSGGSNGGREALIEAERFPEDYNGVVAGAPAVDPANNLSTWAWLRFRLFQNPSRFIPDSKAAMIAAAVMKTCDGLDGVTDGVIDDPTVCNFDPAVLTCPGEDLPNCLTRAQVGWLHDLYQGPGGDYKGRRNWGFERGGETGWVPIWFGKSADEILGPVFSISFFRYLVYGDADWDISRFSFEHDRAAAVERVRGPNFQADDPDLRRFKAHGGKLILFQGWSDPLVPPRIPIDYFKRVQARLGKQATTEFLRLYMAPGVGHVIGGAGPNVFGQLNPGAAFDADHSVTAAVERWVEHGVAPNAIIAGKYDNDLEALLAPHSLKPLRERPLCPYPQIARWDRKGSSDDARSYSCILPRA